MSEEIDITGLNKAQLLAGLFNRARSQGWGFAVATDETMTVAQASAIIKRDRKYNEDLHYDYVAGRSLKIYLGGNTFDPSNYDRDNGQGAAQSVIEAVRGFPVPEEQPPEPIWQRLRSILHLNR